MIDTANPSLDQRPKSLNRVGMDVPVHVHPVFMPNLKVLVPKRLSRIVFEGLNAFIARIFVSVDHAAGSDVLLDYRSQFVGSNTGNNFCYDSLSTFALNDADDRSFFLIATHRTARTILALAAVVGFINLHRWPLQ